MLALRNWRCHAAWAGAIVAWIGAVLEATADAHKLSVKNTLQETAPPVPPSSPDDDDNTTTPIVLERPPSPRFAGPTGGAYRITRHPNYTGEVLHWLGTYVAGTSCLVGRKGCWGWWDAATWLASTAGLYGIVSIMRAATARLEERQSTKYAGDPAYESWKDQVKAPLIPLVNS
jgi:steroid 5-alpha reductase family enzyme